jgi:hypothetical protein
VSDPIADAIVKKLYGDDGTLLDDLIDEEYAKWWESLTDSQRQSMDSETLIGFEAGFRAALKVDSFMPGCTHAGVAKGATCPLCGREVK